MLAAHHQEVLFCIYSNWYTSCVMLTGCRQDRDMAINCTFSCERHEAIWSGKGGLVSLIVNLGIL